MDSEKSFYKIQHPFFIHAVMKLGIKGIFLNIIQGIYDSPIVYHT
jgi:hypothetical protein